MDKLAATPDLGTLRALGTRKMRYLMENRACLRVPGGQGAAMIVVGMAVR